MTVVTLVPLHLPLPTSAALTRRRRGRPPTVNQELIADAVLHVGFVGLTYAAVSERLGVSLATLFRHVRGRDELSRLGLDLAMRRHEWPRLDGPWRPMLEAWAVSAWTLWAAHPGAAVEVSRGVVPPAVVQLSDQVSAALLDAGFTVDNAVRAVDLVFDLVTDSRRGVEALDLEQSSTGGTVRDAIEAQWQRADVDDDVAIADRRAIRASTGDAVRADPMAWFVGKLQVVLAGVEAELAPANAVRALAGAS